MIVRAVTGDILHNIEGLLGPLLGVIKRPVFLARFCLCGQGKEVVQDLLQVTRRRRWAIHFKASPVHDVFLKHCSCSDDSSLKYPSQS